MRGDLVKHLPWFMDNDKLLCPICHRTLGYDDFSIEHIIPKQTVQSDPHEVKLATARDARSKLTLLCRAPLKINGKMVSKNGCNGFKGSHYDKNISFMLKINLDTARVTQRHQFSMFALGLVALIGRCGYRFALSADAIPLRFQFFSPNKRVDEVHFLNEIMLVGEPWTSFTDVDPKYWSDPFDFVSETASGTSRTLIITRNVMTILPIGSFSISEPSLLILPERWTRR